MIEHKRHWNPEEQRMIAHRIAHYLTRWCNNNIGAGDFQRIDIRVRDTKWAMETTRVKNRTQIERKNIVFFDIHIVYGGDETICDIHAKKIVDAIHDYFPVLANIRFKDTFCRHVYIRDTVCPILYKCLVLYDERKEELVFLPNAYA